MNQIFWTGSSAWTMNNANSTVLSLFDNGGTQAKVENQSTGLVTINAPITFAANNGSPPNPFGEINAVNGDLTFATSTLTVNGSSVNGIKLFGGGRVVNFNATVSASGKWFGHTTSGTGNTVNIGGPFTSSDFYVMNGGTLNLNSGGSLTASVRLGGDFGNTGNQDQTKTGTFNLTVAAGGQTFSGVVNSVSGNTSGTLAVNSQNTSGANTLSGHIALDSALKITQAASGTLNITQTKGVDTTTGTDIKGNTLTLTPASGGTITHSGTIYNSTGAGGVTMTGAGTVTYSATHTYSGDTLINAGTLQINNGGSANNSIIRIGDTAANSPAATLSAGSAASFTSTLVVRPSASGTQGTRTIASSDPSGTATMSGSVFLDADATVTSANGGTLAFTGTAFDLKNQTLTVNNAGSVTMSGSTVIQNSTGSGKLVKSGTGTLTLGGNSTFTGGATLNGGTLIINQANALGTLAGTFTINGGSIDNGTHGDITTPSYPQAWNGDFTFIGSQGVSLNLGTGAVTLGANRQVTVSGATLTVGGIISGSTLALTKLGAGTLKIGGGSANTYSGLTTVNAGTLTLNGSASVNAFGGDLTINNGGTVNYNSSDNQIPDAANVTLNSGGTLAFGARQETIGQTSPSVAGSFTMSGGSLTISSGTLTLNRNPTITGGTVTITSSGTMVANQELIMDGGSLDVTYTGASSAGLNLRGGAGTGITYRSNGASGASLSSSGGGTGTALSLNTAGTTVFTINDAAGVDPEMTISMKLTGNNGLQKEGAGTLVLSGANTYSATASTGTIINNGILSVTSDGNLGTSGKAITLGGGTLKITGAGFNSARAFTLTQNSTINNASGGSATLTGGLAKGGKNITFTGTGGTTFIGTTPISGTADVIADATTLEYDVAQTYVGPTFVRNAGTLKLGAANAMPTSTRSALTLDDSGTGNSIFNLNGNSAVVASLSGASSSSATLGSGTLTIGTSSGSATFTGAISGSGGSLVKDNGSTLTLSGNNSFGGTLTVQGGTVATATVNNDSANGPLGSSPNSVTLGASSATGTLEYTGNTASSTKKFTMAASGTGVFQIDNSGQNLTLSGLIDGSGALTKTGSGTLSLSAANTYAGDTTISTGTLHLGASGVIPDGPGKGDVSVGGTLDLNTFSETINGLSGAGTVDTVAGGSPTLTAGNNNASSAFSGIIRNTAGALALTKAGTGTLTLSGANTYTGNTTVSAGTLALSGSGSIANSPTLSVSSGATLDATGRSDGTLTLAAGQTLNGNGTVKGTLAVSANSTLAPGSSVGALINTGSLLLQSGGTNVVEVINATNAPGVGYDSLSASGNIGVQSTTGSPFSIKLASLNGSGVAGSVTNFDNNTNYLWTIASGTVTNFAANKFTIDTASFSNDLAGGQFVIESGSLNLRFTNNHAPLATDANFSRAKDVSLKIKISDLAAHWSDPDGDGTAMIAIAAASTNGASLPTNATYIFYSNTNNVADRFSYTIRDLRSYRAGDTVRTATGLVFINVTNALGIVNTITVSGGTATVSFAGVPGYGYQVQRSTNLVDWATLLTTNAPADGLFQLTDNFSDLGAPPSQAYYRLRQP